MEPESWEDRFGEPEEESQMELFQGDGFIGFWDADNPQSPPVIIRSKLLN